MAYTVEFARMRGSRDKKKRLRRAIKKGLILGSAGGLISHSLQEGAKVAIKKTKGSPFSSKKLALNVVGGALLGGIGEGVAQGILQQYKDGKYKSKQIDKYINYSIDDTINFENKQVKVKSFTRKGKLVKAYVRNNKIKRKRNIAITAGIVSSAGLGIALAKSNKLRILLNTLAINTKGKLKKIPKLVKKDIQFAANTQKVNLVKNAKAVKNTTNKVFFVDDLASKQTYIYKECKISKVYKIGSKFGYGTYTIGNEQASEAIASSVGKKLGVNVQSTRIIGANEIFEGKTPGVPGSMHSVAKGVGVDEIFKDRSFSVSHMSHKTNSRQIVNDLLMSEDMSKIAALDTFIGNGDRNPNNLFYDQATKAFTAIDNGSAYSYPFNYKKLTKAFTSEYSRMSYAQKKNLRTYRDTLQKALKEYTPESLSKEYDSYFVKALTGADKKTINGALTSRNNRTRNIYRSYSETQKLVEELSRLIGK